MGSLVELEPSLADALKKFGETNEVQTTRLDQPV